MNPASLSPGTGQPRRRRLRCWLHPLLAVLVLVLSAASARADLADQHYKRAIKAYETKEYPLSIREFQAAYRARQLPRILLLIGQVYRKLGMASTALKFYQHYLRVEPNPKADVKAEVDRYIAQTQAMLDPPEFESPAVSTAPTVEPAKGAKRRKPTAAEEAAAAVAAAPSNVTSVTVPELYLEDGGDGGRPTAVGKYPAHPVGEPSSSGTAANPISGTPAVVGTPLLNTPDRQAAARTVTPTGAAASPGLDLTPPADKTPPLGSKPFYKQAWFWGVVGGVAGVAIITGVAVGAGQANALPSEVLKPTK